MGSIFEDPARYEFFERTCNPQSGDGSTSIEVWEYHRNIAHARGKFMPVRELVERSSSASLRIIFAPLDRATRPYAADLLMLFRHFRVPSAFIDDNPRSVTLSFGASEDGAGGDCAWFHYLCKNITTHRSPANNQVYISGVLSGEPQFTQGDDSWILCKYFLRWDSGPESASAGQVTLICFGVPPLSNLRLRLSRLPSTWEEVLIDPYALFVIALDELSVQQDALVWGLNDIFRGMEVNALQSASMTNDRAMKGRHDFAGLHNVHKLIIYMSECSSAVMHTLTHLRERHREAMAGAQLQESSRKTMARTQGMLALVETRFETARLRVASLDRRMENLIGLVSGDPVLAYFISAVEVIYHGPYTPFTTLDREIVLLMPC
ncbi:hypothetical protein AJ79_01053 [Helicocarpus griseus UAMH5409]|uniref:Uncharacterized protein n=1 Tax=Helicocarpus griseus UAMH5409 TaxID=1447875 RepID=A0A2B7Y8U3_9EURO|nr:hypothetical protein AJ79_01053 [Helicocarpus griseus UAMH5409]